MTNNVQLTTQNVAGNQEFISSTSGAINTHQALTQDITLATLTAASAGANTADQSNDASSGIKIVIDVTAISGTTPTLTVTLQGKDVASGKYYTILASAAISAVGTTVLSVRPGLTAAANQVANDFLPRTWRVSYAIAGTTPSVTATIGASLN